MMSTTLRKLRTGTNVELWSVKTRPRGKSMKSLRESVYLLSLRLPTITTPEFRENSQKLKLKSSAKSKKTRKERIRRNRPNLMSSRQLKTRKMQWRKKSRM